MVFGRGRRLYFESGKDRAEFVLRLAGRVRAKEGWFCKLTFANEEDASEAYRLVARSLAWAA